MLFLVFFQQNTRELFYFSSRGTLCKVEVPETTTVPLYPAGSEILCIFSNQMDNNEQDTQSLIG